MRRQVLLLVFLAVLAVGASAQTIEVTFTDGAVDYQLKGQTAWKPLQIGTRVPADATLRLQGVASLELLIGKTPISIIKSGTYLVADLQKRVASAGSTGTGLGARVAQKLAAVTYDRQKTATSVGATRGALKDEELFWMDASEETVQEVQGLFAQGKYGDAVPLLDEALAAASTEFETSELNYLLATAYAGSGQTARAWKIVSGLEASPGTPSWAQYAVLKGQLQADAQMWTEALATLKPVLDPLAQDEYGQGACLVAYYCYRGLNQQAEATKIARAGAAIDPTSETGVQLAKLASGS